MPTDVFTRAETASIRAAEVDIKSKDSLAEDLFPSCVLPVMEQLHFPPLKSILQNFFFICGIKLLGWRGETKTNPIYAGKEGGIKKIDYYK